jgi:predicted SAM-dependent methyltransferase
MELAKVRQRAAARFSPEARASRRVRRRLANRYLAGDGLEIGALHRPLLAPRAARVRYVDRMDVAALRDQYPELADLPLVDVDLIDDGETLSKMADGSQDFVIANHFIEHTQNPLATLYNHARVLRTGGTLYLAVPDKRRTFDADRQVTPLEHVVRDLHVGPQWSRAQHFEEWARFVEKLPEDQVGERARELERRDYSIHFHVWTPQDFLELLVHARNVEGIPLDVEALECNGDEFIVVLRRSSCELTHASGQLGDRVTASVQP